MDKARFDAWTRALVAPGSRRQALARLGGVVALSGVAETAGKRQKNKPLCHCEGSRDACPTITVSPKSRKKHLKNHPLDTPGPCPATATTTTTPAPATTTTTPLPPECQVAGDCPQPDASQVCAVRVCRNGSCSLDPKSTGTLCRPAAGDCDLPEFCDGASLTCPAHPTDGEARSAILRIVGEVEALFPAYGVPGLAGWSLVLLVLLALLGISQERAQPQRTTAGEQGAPGMSESTHQIVELRIVHALRAKMQSGMQTAC